MLAVPAAAHVRRATVPGAGELAGSLWHHAWAQAAAVPDGVFNSAEFSIIATDAEGIIQMISAGTQRVLGYAVEEVVNRITPSDIQDPAEAAARAERLSRELGVRIAPGLGALACKASRGIGDTHEVTYICKDGSRLPAIVSVTALRDEATEIVGYLLIGTQNHLRRRSERLVPPRA